MQQVYQTPMRKFPLIMAGALGVLGLFLIVCVMLGII